MAYGCPLYDTELELAVDHDTAIVTREMWEAERAKLSKPTGIAARYEARHGVPAATAIRSMARRMTKSEVARAIGWGTPQPLTAWLRARGETVEFVRRQSVPPKGKGWQSE